MRHARAGAAARLRQLDRDRLMLRMARRDARDDLGTEQLRDGLQRLADHPRCRLPMEEVTARLERYAHLLAGEV
jgi:hypothetical protein